MTDSVLSKASSEANKIKSFFIHVSITEDKKPQFLQYLGTFELAEKAEILENLEGVSISLNATDAQIQDFVLFGIHIYPGIVKVSINSQ